MANCNSLEGILKGCDNNAGGIYEAYFIDQDSVTGVTVNATAHTITAIGTIEDFTPFQFKRNVGNLVVSPTIDLVNGSTFYTSTLTLAFHKREGIKSRALQILAEGQRYLGVIIKDANGKYWYLDYAQLNGGDEESGTAKADGSKYTVTFVAEMDNRPYEVDSTIIAALIS
jgi:hypothetical protein